MGAVKEQLIQVTQEIEEAGHNAEAFIIYLSNDHIPLDEWHNYTDQFEDSYVGQFDSRTDFTNDYIDQTGLLQDHTYNLEDSAILNTLIRYFDVDSFGRDLMNDYWETDGHYFRSY